MKVSITSNRRICCKLFISVFYFYQNCMQFKSICIVMRENNQRWETQSFAQGRCYLCVSTCAWQPASFIIFSLISLKWFVVIVVVVVLLTQCCSATRWEENKRKISFFKNHHCRLKTKGKEFTGRCKLPITIHK